MGPSRPVFDAGYDEIFDGPDAVKRDDIVSAPGRTIGIVARKTEKPEITSVVFATVGLQCVPPFEITMDIHPGRRLFLDHGVDG
jgi:hypothetical protein